MSWQRALDNTDLTEIKTAKRTPLPWSVLFAGLILLAGISAIVFSIYLNLPPHPPVKDFGLPSGDTGAMSAVFTALRSRYSPDELVIVCENGTETELIDWFMNTHRAEHEGKTPGDYMITHEVPSDTTADVLIITPAGKEAEYPLFIGDYSSGSHSVSLYLSPHREEPAEEPVVTEGRLPEASFCTAVVPSEFTPYVGDDGKITFRHNEYPHEAATVSFSVIYGALPETLTKEELEGSLSSSDKAVYGEAAGLELTSFAKKNTDGFPSYYTASRLHGIGERDILRTSLLILSDNKTFVLSCARADDDILCTSGLESFISSARVQKQ